MQDSNGKTHSSSNSEQREEPKEYQEEPGEPVYQKMSVLQPIIEKHEPINPQTQTEEASKGQSYWEGQRKLAHQTPEGQEIDFENMLSSLLDKSLGNAKVSTVLKAKFPIKKDIKYRGQNGVIEGELVVDIQNNGSDKQPEVTQSPQREEREIKD